MGFSSTLFELALLSEVSAATIPVWAIFVAGPAGAALLLRAALRRRSVRHRLLRHRGFAVPASRPRESQGASKASGFHKWLVSAGYDGPAARGRFLAWMTAAALAGAFIALMLDSSGFQERGILWLEDGPGGLADTFIPVMKIATWLLGFSIALAPIVWVRRERRERISEVEKDLPYVLSLLATLVESGLGFDAAAMRVERALGPERILAQELARVRANTLAGATRPVAIREMAQRLDVPTLTAFSSALIHAENQGASIGETLRRQAQDLWARRREEAIQSAQTLPTKLAFPLVICFLPGVFVWTFGPAVSEFLRLANSTINGRS